jgi:hypothetical protein
VRSGLAFMILFPWLAHGGTPYVVVNRHLSPHSAAASYAQFYVQDGKVRAGGFDASTVYLFKDDRIYVIDNASRSVQVVTSGLVDQAAARLDERVTMVQNAAAKLPPDKRAVMERLAADMKAQNDSRRLPVPREYRITDRSETVDGHPCRIWEAFEQQEKRFELCVAPVAQIPGGAEILGGMKSLSSYWQGSVFALGVSLGNAGWWPGIASLNGVPILVREFKRGTAVSETALTAIGDGVPSAPPFDLPDGYPMTEVAAIP